MKRPPKFAWLTFDVILFSAPRTTPPLVRIPTHDPALEMASIAYLHQYFINKRETLLQISGKRALIKLLTLLDEVVLRARTARKHG